MGFDTYMSWKGQTEAEKEAQFIGGMMNGGHVGYLRGGYALDIVPSDAWDTPVKASEMRRRLPKAVKGVRGHLSGSLQDVMIKSLNDFVDLAERKEKETGEPVTITVMLCPRSVTICTACADFL